MESGYPNFAFMFRKLSVIFLQFPYGWPVQIPASRLASSLSVKCSDTASIVFPMLSTRRWVVKYCSFSKLAIWFPRSTSMARVRPCCKDRSCSPGSAFRSHRIVLQFFYGAGEERNTHNGYSCLCFFSRRNSPCNCRGDPPHILFRRDAHSAMKPAHHASSFCPLTSS